MKFSLKMPQLITTRPDGKKAFTGLTAGEWGISLLVIALLYGVLVGYFTALLTISQSFRGSRDYVSLSFFLLHSLFCFMCYEQTDERKLTIITSLL